MPGRDSCPRHPVVAGGDCWRSGRTHGVRLTVETIVAAVFPGFRYGAVAGAVVWGALAVGLRCARRFRRLDDQARALVMPQRFGRMRLTLCGADSCQSDQAATSAKSSARWFWIRQARDRQRGWINASGILNPAMTAR